MYGDTKNMKTWLITGVSSGFGYELTKQLLDSGDTVIGTVKNLIDRYGKKLDCRILDVTDVSAVQNIVKDSFETHGKIDVVISNAGYGLFGAAEELSDEQINHIIATNLTGQYSAYKINAAVYEKARRWQDYSDFFLRRTSRVCRKLYVPRNQVRNRGLLRSCRAGSRKVQYRRNDSRTGRSKNRVQIRARMGCNVYEIGEAILSGKKLSFLYFDYGSCRSSKLPMPSLAFSS